MSTAETKENVHALFSPNPVAMLDHLEHLFGGYLDGYHDGLIELAWTDRIANADGRYPLRHAKMFGTDELEQLITEAIALNSQPMCNVYVGAALRKPGTFPGARASASDILALTCAYVDLDDKGAAGQARQKYQHAKPTKIVITGKEPHTRAQMWWRLDEPIVDQAVSERMLRGIAAAMGGDPSVSDPPRVMRLAGSIAWPMKPDRKRPELTAIVNMREPGQRMYTVEHLAKTFPFAGAETGDVVFTGDVNVTPGADGITRNTDTFGLEAKVADGRERYMVKTINAVLIELIGQNDVVPTGQELFDAAWSQYERSTDLTRPGRGRDEFGRKCAYAVKRFLEGKIRGCETVEIVRALYRQRQEARRATGHKDNYDYSAEFKSEPPKVDPATGHPLPLVLTAEQFVGGFSPPNYLIDGILQRGYLYSLTARTGHGKTAVAMYIAQCIARGEAMHGRTVKAGTVLLLAGENPNDIRARLLVLADAYGFVAEALKLRVVAGVIDIMVKLPEIRAAADTIDDLVLVIVDTAAAYFLGDETNSNAQQGAYARVLRQLTFLPGLPAVLVNCHPIKNASQDNLLPMGGSAFVNEVDGNLTLWADAEKQTVLHWLGKFRGPEFDPISFELRVAESPRVHDLDGRLMPSVVAVPIADITVEAGRQRFESEENIVLHILGTEPNATMDRIATRAGFMNEGRPNKTKVHRLIKNLEAFKFVVKHRSGKYRVTDKGKKEVGL